MARGAYIDEKIVNGILMLHSVNPELKYTKIAEVYPVDASTVGKIIASGSWEGYCRFKDEKAAKQRERKAKKAEPKQLELQGGVDYQVQVNEQLAGQMKMELPEEKPELSDNVKMMRFLAGKFEELERKMGAVAQQQQDNTVNVCGMITRMCTAIEKTNDYLGQILRVIGPEGGRK